MAKTKLKPCPFCGSEKIEVAEDGGYSENTRWIAEMFVQCHSCWAATAIAASRSTAVRKWNRRAKGKTNEAQ